MSIRIIGFSKDTAPELANFIIRDTSAAFFSEQERKDTDALIQTSECLGVARCYDQAPLHVMFNCDELPYHHLIVMEINSNAIKRDIDYYAFIGDWGINDLMIAQDTKYIGVKPVPTVEYMLSLGNAEFSRIKRNYVLLETEEHKLPIVLIESVSAYLPEVFRQYKNAERNTIKESLKVV